MRKLRPRAEGRRLEAKDGEQRVLRALFLAASESRWLREHGVRAPFIRRAVARFMPGEHFNDMLRAARMLPSGIGSLFTKLGENVASRDEAVGVADHYADGIATIRQLGLACEPSVKPTQLGLDLDHAGAREQLHRLGGLARMSQSYLWIDMEQSTYVDATLALAEGLRTSNIPVGVCLQAYLHRTPEDLQRMLRAGIGVRLVKGAYREPATMALASKREVDERFAILGRAMIDHRAHGGQARVVFGTHDTTLIDALVRHARSTRTPQGGYEIHMLYGIGREAQQHLAAAGEHVRVLIAYGTYWFPWYMRRLAERPANAWFVLRSAFR